MKPLNDPGDLCEALGIPFSPEQLNAICAPLEPQVIVAGAGTGKTTVMAARVVWSESLEAVVRERRDWSDFYRACHEVGQ